MSKEKPTKPLKEIPKIQNENAALRQENLKLQRRIVTLEAQMISARNKIIALQDRIPVEQLTDDELEEAIQKKKTELH
jgi:chromosome segregation ATPase